MVWPEHWNESADRTKYKSERSTAGLESRAEASTLLNELRGKGGR